MIKTNADNFWLDLGVANEKPAAMSNSVWLSKSSSILRHFLIASGKLSAALISALVFNDEQKTKDGKQNIRDEFYFGSLASRKKIPRRIWKRHSALLHYHQQQIRQQPRNATCQKPMVESQSDKVRQVESASEITAMQAVVNKRMSFRVKSIRLLPIWGTALSDISLIEDDLSSLRFVESSSAVNNIDKAA